jgi:hypothetical protein
VAGPRKLWKTEIVIWSDFNPTKVPVARLAQEGESGSAYIGKAHSELISSPYGMDDSPPEDFFEDTNGDDTN